MQTIATHPRQTDRLLLRPPTVQDAPALFRNYTTDSEVTRYLIWKPHQAMPETETFLAARVKDWQGGTERAWVIEERSTPGEAIGMISLRPQDGFKASMGYVLARKFWGRGYMPEAARLVISIGFGELLLYRIAAFCDVENLGSARVMEKAGMLKEGLLRRYVLHPNASDEPRDALIYAATR